MQKGADRASKRLQAGMRGLIVDSVDDGFNLLLFVEFSHTAYPHIGDHDLTVKIPANCLKLFRQP